MQTIIEISPHIKSKQDIPYIMKQVIIACLPAIIVSIVFFKIKAFLLIITCVASSILSEEIILKIRKKQSQIKDCSAAVTGILLALILPPSTSIGVAITGSIFAIVVVKQLFGGLGKNIFNPALAARAFLMAAFPVALTSWTEPTTLQAVTKATPLAMWKFHNVTANLKDLFLGNISGSLGETSALAIIIGGIYMLYKQIADWKAPVGMLTSITIFSGIMYLINHDNGSIAFHLFSGGIMLGMFFMITDPVTTPITKSGRFIFGAGVGIMVMIIRFWGGLPEGVMYSILFFNSLTPLINKLTKPKSLGR